MTTITGLIGYPVAHSLSPHIHAYWCKKYNVDVEYKLFTTAPPRLRQTMHHMRTKNWRGINVTVPHKQAVLEYLDSIDVLGTKIGAVNTITNTDGKLTGTNTDAYGFITNLRAGLTGSVDGDLTPHLARVVLLGAGGATRAAIVALQEAGAKTILLTNRTHDTAQKLAKDFFLPENFVLPWEARHEALANATLLVNTTSLGMQNHDPLELDLSQLPTTAAVHDIVYAPLETNLLKNARSCGNPTVDGLGMLLYQAQRAFKEWHDILPEVTPELRAHILAMGEEK